MVKMKKKKLLCAAALLLAFAAVFGLLTRVLSPKYMTELEEGSMISEYYAQAGGHDVIFIGDCEIYDNFSPLELWRTHGITSYVRGSAHQLIWQSYYILKETLRYETPQAVVFNVSSMRTSEPDSEPYNRLAIDQMRWSAEKVGIIRASMTEEEDFLSYVFPLLRYHSRYSELTGEDLEYLFKAQTNFWNGYQLHTGVEAPGKLPTRRPLADYTFADVCYEYLEKMADLCAENGVELILVKAPSLYPYWYDEYDAQIAVFAEGHGLAYYNFVPLAEEIGLDYTTDTYDGGLHLNLSGTVKLCGYFGDILAEDHGLADHRSDPEIAAEYNEKLKQYDETIQNER